MKKPPIDSSQPRLRAPAFLRKAGSLLALPLASALAMMAGSANAQNLLADPGFEPPGGMAAKWTVQGGTTTLNTDVAFVHGGSQSVKTTAGTTAASLRGIQQTAATGGWTLPANKIFRYKAWVLQPAAATTNVNFRFSHQYNGVITDPCATVLVNTNTWQQVVSPWFNAPSNNTGSYVRFQFQGITAAAPIGYMDDMELETADGVLVTASVTTGGSITDVGTYAVVSGSNKTFTITKQFGYGIGDVTVDTGSGPVSQGAVSSVTLTNITATTTVAATLVEASKHTVSGHVSAASGGGATVVFKSSDGKIQYTATTDSSGNYSQLVYDAAYTVTAAQTGFVAVDQSLTVSADTTGIDFTLAAGRNIPRMENLIFFADTANFTNTTTEGASTGNWNVTYPAGGVLTAMVSPALTKVNGIKYEMNSNLDGDGYRFGSAGGYYAGGPLICDGATIMALVQPVYYGTGNNWQSVVDVFGQSLILGLDREDGQVMVRRNNIDYRGTAIPNGQITLLTLVVQSTGTFTVYARAWNATSKTFNAATTPLTSAVASTYTQMVPQSDWRQYINIGRNNPDGWSTCNARIGDVALYKVALSDTERGILEADVQAKLANVPTYNITASVSGVGGTISPLGVTSVGETDNQTYTITPEFGYDVSDVTVTENGATASKGAVSTYTFTAVVDVGSITVTFVAKPTYAVSGKVTNGSTPIAGAKVYVSTSANASVTPYYILTTDPSGNYSVNLFNATWYVCASATGYLTSTDITATPPGAPVINPDIALTAGRIIPQMDQLLVAAFSQSFAATAGTNTGNWPVYHPLGDQAFTAAGSPMVEEDPAGTKWAKLLRATSDRYVWKNFSSPIAFSGATVVAAVKPVRLVTDGGQGDVATVFYNKLSLRVNSTTGIVTVNANGNNRDSIAALPDGQKTILSMIVQADGNFKLYANGLEMAMSNSTSMGVLTSLTPGGNWYEKSVGIGFNNPDTWSCFNGSIGDVLIYKTALGSADRVALENSLGTQFGITLPVYHNITVSAGTGGTITPAGTQSVLDGSNLTFTITPNLGYKIDDVTLDGVSQGAVGSLPLTNITIDHAVAATFAVVPQWTVTGKVTDNKTSAAIAGASVYLSLTPNAKMAPAYTATTDASGNFSQVVYEASYYVASGATDYYTSADITRNVTADTANVDFALASSIRNIPAQSDLWFSALTDTFPASGPTGNWASFQPSGLDFTAYNTPTVQIINNQKWELNLNSNATAYKVFGPDSASTPVSGATIVVAVKPIRVGTANNWQSVVDIYRDNLVLGIQNGSGLVNVWRNNNLSFSSTPIPDGQLTILSLVVQPNGTYVVYANGLVIMENTTPSTFDNFVPMQNGAQDWRSYVDIGRNQGDGWATFNGNIGDVFVYKKALDPADRVALEADLANKFGITFPVTYTITATAGPNGTISPSGAVQVAEHADQTFTFSPTAGYVDVLTVDGVVQTEPVHPTSYTFFDVAEAGHTIDVTFTVEPGPANDFYVGAIPLAPAAGGTQTGTSTLFATTEAGEPAFLYADPDTHKSVWFNWTAPANGNFTLSTDGSLNTASGPWDAVIYFYDGGSLATLHELQPGVDGGQAETMTQAVTAGTTYTIRLAWGGGGTRDATNLLLTWSFVGTGNDYTSWAATHADNQAPNLDFDNDGISNGVEFFMGAPAGFTANPPVVTNAGVRTVTWDRDPTAIVTSWMVQVSDNLGTWTDVLPSDPSIDYATDPTKVVYTLPAGTKEFCRLVVVVPAP